VYALAGRACVCLSVHRAVADADAWAALLADFVRLLDGDTPAEAGPPAGYREWLERVDAHGRSEALYEEIPFWERQVSPDGGAADSGAAYPSGPYAQLALSLPDVTADQLDRANHAFNTHTGHLVLTAAKLAALDAWDADGCLVVLEASARDAFAGEAPRPFSPVGNYAAHFPLRLTGAAGADPLHHLKTTKEQVNGVPRRGIGFGLLAAGRPEAAPGNFPGGPVLGFAYVPPVTLPVAGFSLAEDLADDTAGLPPGLPLHVAARLRNGSLAVTVYHDPAAYPAATVHAFGRRLEHHVRALVARCANQEHQQLTPSDYGSGRMSLDDLALINALYE
jgi:non-ribosomal peptide synthase protein (TIGR01720 family)